MCTARLLPYDGGGVYVWGVSLRETLDRDPLDRDSHGQSLPGQRPPGQRPLPGQRPPAKRPPWSCDLWCMLGQRPPPPMDRILDTSLWKHYLAATLLRAVIIDTDKPGMPFSKGCNAWREVSLTSLRVAFLRQSQNCIKSYSVNLVGECQKYNKSNFCHPHKCALI